MTKNPYDTFFWNDYENDTALKSCSDAAQGVWMRLLCMMARSPERGVLLIGDFPPQRAAILRPLANYLGRTEEYIDAILTELLQSKTAALDGQGRVVNRRMVRAREIADVRSEAGKSGAKARWQTDGKHHGKPDGKTKRRTGTVTHGKDGTIPDKSTTDGCEGDGKTMPSSSSGASKKKISTTVTVEAVTAPEGSGAGERGERTSGSDAGSQKARPTTRGTRIPDGWLPGPETEQFARDLGLTPKAVTDEFTDFWRGVAGSKGVKLDWDATYRNRCRQLAERKNPNGSKRGANPRDAASGAPTISDGVAAAFARRFPEAGG